MQQAEMLTDSSELLRNRKYSYSRRISLTRNGKAGRGSEDPIAANQPNWKTPPHQ
uniref:Uncharacterized protein n=1 Tax=Picea glauca TaxID=3330 RepID=A0A101LUW5_PICGL|nr:hypothetical protein ABT39_MTgene2317 [Picea glauca]